MITSRSAKILALLSTHRARTVLAALESGRRSVAEIERAGIDRGTLSRTLRALEDAGLIAVPDVVSVATRLEQATLTVAARLAEIGAEVSA